MAAPVNGSGERARLEKLAKLLTVAQELQDKLHVVTTEMEAILGGLPGVGAVLKHLQETFSVAWQGRYGAPYVWNYTEDVPQQKRLLKRLEAVELERRMVEYLDHADPYLLSRRHSFSLFVRNINDYATDTLHRSLCPHSPPCERMHMCAARELRERHAGEPRSTTQATDGD